MGAQDAVKIRIQMFETGRFTLLSKFLWDVRFMHKKFGSANRQSVRRTNGSMKGAMKHDREQELKPCRLNKGNGLWWLLISGFISGVARSAGGVIMEWVSHVL
ncbi:hypothetical protein ACFS5L_28900 [Streptomyces phyllanthi]|uniref:hypothetical protein n=1 Tax=Streptomyces phyllanthi TaxID=1803180 RepID=UPI0031E67ACD